MSRHPVKRRPPVDARTLPAITRDPDFTPAPCPAQDQAADPDGHLAYWVACGLTAHHRGWHLSSCGWSWNPQDPTQNLRFPTTLETP